MATHEDANLILKLYELRRESRMREARDWFASKFRPQSPQDVLEAITGPNSADLRMVASYWEMAAAMVNHGTIDRDLFCESNGEQFMVFAKIQPFLADLRERFANPRMFANLERLAREAPQGPEAITRWQNRWKAEAAAQPSSAAS